MRIALVGNLQDLSTCASNPRPSNTVINFNNGMIFKTIWAVPVLYYLVIKTIFQFFDNAKIYSFTSA